MQLKPFAFLLILTTGLCAAGTRQSLAQTAVTQTTTTTSNGVTQTVIKTADGKTQTITTTPAGTTLTSSGETTTLTTNQSIIVNGVKYECPMGSILTVGADGKAVITPLSAGATTSKSGVTIITSPTGGVTVGPMTQNGLMIATRSPATASAAVSQNRIRGTNNTVDGTNNSVSGNDNRVSGSSNAVDGNKSIINGSNNALQGNGNTIHGSDNALNGDVNTVNGSDDAVNSSGSMVSGSNKTIVTPHKAAPAPAEPSRTVNVNTVNGVKYRSPVGSVLSVDADGTKHLTFPAR